VSNRMDLIELARKIFLKLEAELIDEKGKLNRKLYSDALDIFSIISSEKINELESEVFRALKCKDEDIREAAVLTLGLKSRLGVQRFRDVAFKIWLEDESLSVKRAALAVWAGYYDCSQDPVVLKILYEILKNRKYSIDIRCEALFSMFTVMNETSKFFNPHNDTLSFTYPEPTPDEFNKKIDWEELELLLRKYIPEEC